MESTSRSTADDQHKVEDINRLMAAQLVKFLRGGQSYIKLEQMLEKINLDVSGKEIFGMPYTVWQLLEHIRISQKDILDFSVDPGYKELKWPEEYWVPRKGPKDEEELRACIRQILSDREEMVRLIESNSDILLEKIPHGSGQTLMREAMITAEHNAYHAGEIVVLLRVLGAWKD